MMKNVNCIILYFGFCEDAAVAPLIFTTDDGNHVETLHREQIGKIDLGILKEGEWRSLTDKEIALF